MAHYIQFLQDGAAVPFNEIDEKLCAEFGVKCDDKKYYLSWYTIVGLGTADGSSLRELADDYISSPLTVDQDTAAALYWIDQNYTFDHWHGR